jgi:glycerophosphoryl diester phosphodiesterase
MWIYPKVVAHRGGGTLAPENTLAGLKRGMQAGFRAIEFDVMLARDGVPVLMHDPDFGRTVKGEGSVAASTPSTWRAWMPAPGSARTTRASRSRCSPNSRSTARCMACG